MCFEISRTGFLSKLEFNFRAAKLLLRAVVYKPSRQNEENKFTAVIN